MSVFGGSDSVASRYFGAAASIRNLGLLGGGRGGGGSIGTSESFTEDQHAMTRAELEYQPSDEEYDVNERVLELLRERMVYGRGSLHFGLKWECGTVDQADHVVGGWLSQVTTKSFLSSTIANGQTRFCVLDDKAQQFQQCLEVTLKVRRAIPYDEVHAVRPRCQLVGGDHSGQAWYLQVFGRNVKWELMPIQHADSDLVVRWAAALQFRSGAYDASLSRDVVRANKAAVWTQSHYRRWKAKIRVQRRRDRQNALVTRLASYFGWVDDDDDLDDDGEEGFGVGEPAPGYMESVLEVASNLWGTVGSWLGLGGIAEEEEQEDEPETKETARRVSVVVQSRDDLPPLQEGQEEDEVWENQRWTPGAGWTARTLGKTERCAFSDRLGRGNLPAPQDTPLDTAAWRRVFLPGSSASSQGFDLDLSGVNRAQCDAEGFTYSFDWPLLDANLAKGVFAIHHGSKDFVRRRRWCRVREPVSAASSSTEQAPPLLSTTQPILCSGWLGMKTSQGRWHSRQFVLVRPGVTIGQHKLRHPALVQFRVSFRDYAGVTRNGGTDGAQWRMLTDKSVSVLELPPKSTHCDEQVATAKFPGYFNLVVDGIQRSFSCSRGDLQQDRVRWTDAITAACREASKQSRPRTLRLVGGAFETACYPTVIMDSVLLAPVDAVEEAFFQSPSVAAAVNVRQAHTGVVSSAWTLPAQQRTVTYRDRDGLPVSELWQRARTEPGQGFIVDRRVESPKAQFGDEFAVKLRFVLCKCELQGEYGTRVLCSVDVEYLKDTMMVGFIASEAKKNSTVALRDVWLPCVVSFLQTQGVLSESSTSTTSTIAGSSAVQRKITWGAQGHVSSKPGKTQQQQPLPAGVPRDDSAKIEVGRW